MKIYWIVIILVFASFSIDSFISSSFANSSENLGLLQMARLRFTGNSKLNDAEEYFFSQIENSHEADYEDSLNDVGRGSSLKNADRWDKNKRMIRSDCISWLCGDPVASSYLKNTPLVIRNAIISGGLNLSSMNIPRPLVLQFCSIPQGINLQYATLDSLNLDGSHVGNIYGLYVNCNHDISLSNKFTSDAGVFFIAANLKGGFICVNSTFINAPTDVHLAFDANGAVVKGGLVFTNSIIYGCVRLVGGSFGVIKCDGTHLEPAQQAQSDRNSDRRISIEAYLVNVESNVYLSTGFEALGEVQLNMSTIGRDLWINDAKFLNQTTFSNETDDHNPTSLNVDEAIIKGKLVSNYYHTQDTEISGVLSLRRAAISTVNLNGIKESPSLSLDFSDAKIGNIINTDGAWPTDGHLRMIGCVYNNMTLSANSDQNTPHQVDWLNLQENGGFYAQPYEQAASIARKEGRDEDVTLLMLAKNGEHALYTQYGSNSWWWYNVFGYVIGYGYMPRRAFCISACIVLLGSLIFSYGNTKDIIMAVKDDSERRPVFHPLIYSLESFVPLLKLGVVPHWFLNAKNGHFLISGKIKVFHTGQIISCYLWLHIIAGWVFTALWVGSITGLVKS